MEWPEELFFVDERNFPQRYYFVAEHNQFYAVYMGGTGKMPIRVYYSTKDDEYTAGGSDTRGKATFSMVDCIDTIIKDCHNTIAHLTDWRKTIMVRDGNESQEERVEEGVEVVEET